MYTVIEQKDVNEFIEPSWGLNLDIPRLTIGIREGVYVPKLDSFLLVSALLGMVNSEEALADIGTGSGILALIGAKLGARAVATDIHGGSVECTRYNAQLNNVDIDARVGDLWTPLWNEKFDLVVTNPLPYLYPRRGQLSF